MEEESQVAVPWEPLLLELAVLVLVAQMNWLADQPSSHLSELLEEEA